MKVHLVDGTFELFRAYYGGPARESPGGVEVGAVRTLMGSLWRLLQEGDVTHIACAFDSVVESFRNDLFEGYKTGEGIEPELLAQFPLAEKVARALGIVVWPMVEYEADDALATGARRYATESGVEQVILCSPDKDLAQCVRGSRIVGLDRIRSRILDEAGVVEKFGVPPDSIPDWLALVGDSADGIPGVPRWGAKSTARVLGRYRRLEAIPDVAEEWDVDVRGAASLARSLGEHRDAALLYRELATLRDDVPLEEDLDALEWRGAERSLLEPLCEELGDERFPTRVTRWAEDVRA